jgi:hypothetical protein
MDAIAEYVLEGNATLIFIESLQRSIPKSDFKRQGHLLVSGHWSGSPWNQVFYIYYIVVLSKILEYSLEDTFFLTQFSSLLTFLAVECRM